MSSAVEFEDLSDEVGISYSSEPRMTGIRLNGHYFDIPLKVLLYILELQQKLTKSNQMKYFPQDEEECRGREDTSIP